MKRPPAVAGQFYNGTPEGLTRQVSQYILDSPKEPVLGALCPHAGLMYSGHVAGAVYSRIEFPETFIFLGPNHTGLGSPVSIMSEGQWEIPTGRFEIEKVLAHKIHTLSDGLIEKDSRAHLFEHSIEVQLPFIAYFSTSVKIVPIALMTLDLETCHKVARAIVSAVK
ncbi:MAG: AmmeMemoRadiSam system protein B, partial [Nitrospirae bacterium]|nr:AmmeMemoRadiSam system protein B [Nitrospirota bacterium]